MRHCVTTRAGKTVHLLSLHDLGETVDAGARIRTLCPIHGGDHQRSLSIDASNGWGFCHACHATVFVEEADPDVAERLRQEPRGERLCDPPPSPSPSAAGEPRGFQRPVSRIIPPSSALPRAASVPQWQRDEVAALHATWPLMREALVSWRASTYLRERGIPPDLAASCGLGYLSRAVWQDAPVTSAEQQALLKRWIGRVVFPLGLGSPESACAAGAGAAGSGFIGRTLLRWEPGMDENAHKALLDAPGAPRRWIKTNPAGWFGFGDPARLGECVVIVEGGFDRLALMAAGLPASAIVALAGTAARPEWLSRLAPQVRGVVLALDADQGGEQAMQRLADEFRQAGIAVTCCPPARDGWGKDWNERWRRIGPQCAWPLYTALSYPTAHRFHTFEKGVHPLSRCFTVYHATDIMQMVTPQVTRWQARLTHHYALVAHVRVEDREEDTLPVIPGDLLDTVFALTNHVEHNWTNNPAVFWHACGEQRSTSVGDVIVECLSDRAWMVMPCGYCTLP